MCTQVCTPFTLFTLAHTFLHPPTHPLPRALQVAKLRKAEQDLQTTSAAVVQGKEEGKRLAQVLSVAQGDLQLLQEQLAM